MYFFVSKLRNLIVTPKKKYTNTAILFLVTLFCLKTIGCSEMSAKNINETRTQRF